MAHIRQRAWIFAVELTRDQRGKLGETRLYDRFEFKKFKTRRRDVRKKFEFEVEHRLSEEELWEWKKTINYVL